MRRNSYQRSARIGGGLLLLLLAALCALTGRAWQQSRWNNALADAIKRNDSNGVQAALRDGADVNCRDGSLSPDYSWQVWLQRLQGHSGLKDRGNSMLSVAIGLHEIYEDYTPPHYVPRRDAAVVRILAQAGADPNLVTTDGSTALMQAVEWLDADSVQLLLKHKANVNVRDKNGLTPLMIAVGSSDTKEARLLLAHGADLEATDKAGLTALMWAANNGTPDMMRFLLTQNVAVTATDNKGKTALQHARDSYNTQSARLLKKAGAN